LAKNVRLIKRGVDVSAIRDEVNRWEEDWGVQKSYENTDQLHDLPVAVLQLVIGVVAKEGDHPSDSELSQRTPLYDKYEVTRNWLQENAPLHDRVAFLRLPVGGDVGMHIDTGSYYLTRDRYHLSIQGTYIYRVGDQEVIIEPGTWFWFNNKIPHGTKNIGNEPRITMVFDLPHSQENP
jgi:mannose-6-phosphate isomerase-like protein (cupin superfamily)